MIAEYMQDYEVTTQAPFRDRRDAGRQLARRLQDYAGRGDLLVLALPRGGVPVAFEVAQALEAPLDVCVVRKLRAPGQESFTLGAVAAGGAWTLDESLIRELRINDRILREIAERGFRELREREQTYRGDWLGFGISDRTVILVDEGARTGQTLYRAAAALRRHAPAEIVAAVPTASAAARAQAARSVDDWVALFEPDPFISIDLAYGDFTRPSLQLVRKLLRFPLCLQPTDGSASVETSATTGDGHSPPAITGLRRQVEAQAADGLPNQGISAVDASDTEVQVDHPWAQPAATS